MMRYATGQMILKGQPVIALHVGQAQMVRSDSEILAKLDWHVALISKDLHVNAKHLWCRIEFSYPSMRLVACTTRAMLVPRRMKKVFK
jgi:hypothetical protein